MTITWHRNPNGTSTTVIDQPAPGPQADVTVVDRSDQRAVADWNAGIAPARTALPGETRITNPLLLASRRAALTVQTDDDGDSYSTDTDD